MDPKAVSKAKARLRVAAHQLENAVKAKNHEEFSDHWYLFLIAAKNVYTILEQGAKTSPQSRQWFGAKKNERKNDPLLQYLFQARDDDEHGLGDVTKVAPGFVGIGTMEPGYSNSISFSVSQDEKGRVTFNNLESRDGLPIKIKAKPPHPVLLPVTGRGNIKYAPPATHLGHPLPDSQPISVGKAGLAYLEALVAEADSRAA